MSCLAQKSRDADPTSKQFKSTQAESIGRSPAEKAIRLQKQLYYSMVTAQRQDAEVHPHFCDYPVELFPMHLACEMTRFSLDMFLQSKCFCSWASTVIIRLFFMRPVLQVLCAPLANEGLCIRKQVWRTQCALLFNSFMGIIISFPGSAIIYSLEIVHLPLYKTQRKIIWLFLVIENSGFLFKFLPLFLVCLHIFFPKLLQAHTPVWQVWSRYKMIDENHILALLWEYLL